MINKKGFTMVELLVVLVIVAILAAVATPLFVQNTKRAKASEAIATMGLMRQALRDYKINTNTYFDVTSDNIQDPLPPTSEITKTTGVLANPNNFGLDVDVGVGQYFSNAAFTVEAKGTTGTITPSSDVNSTKIFENPSAVDFLIKVDGSKSVSCKATGADLNNCAVKADEVANYRIEMDNSGRVAISYKDGAANTWSNY